MNVSAAGIAFIQSFEGNSLVAYPDQAGKPTIGRGHLILPGEDFSAGLTQEQVDALFLQDLGGKAVGPVNTLVGVSLSQQEFDALVSLCFNIGAGDFGASTLLRLLNQGAPVACIAAEFGKWIYAGGQVSDGLFERRGAEADIFLHGNYVNHA